MKSLLQPALLFLLCIVVWGCPYDSPYAIDPEPQAAVDESLVGKWAAFVQRPSFENEYTESPVKLIFSKKSEMEYDIALTGYIDELKKYRLIENDTIRGTAFISTVDNHEFLNAFIKGKVYLAEIKREANGISILMLAEHFTNRYVKNSEQLRNAVSLHYKLRPQPMYDEWFVAKNLQKVN